MKTRYRLFAGLLGLACVTTAPAQDEGEIEEVEITGSRIERGELTAKSPVVSVDPASLDVFGSLSVGDVGDVDKSIGFNLPDSVIDRSRDAIDEAITEAMQDAIEQAGRDAVEDEGNGDF